MLNEEQEGLTDSGESKRKGLSLRCLDSHRFWDLHSVGVKVGGGAAGLVRALEGQGFSDNVDFSKGLSEMIQ